MTHSIAIPQSELPSVPQRRPWPFWATIAAFIALIVLVGNATLRTPGSRLPSERAPVKSSAPGAGQVAAPIAATSYDPRDIKPLSAPDAMAVNAAIPVAGPVGSGAAAFTIDPAKSVLRETALQCLTTALYYEAASENDDGQRAVAQVILNRMRHPTYPASVCGVVYQGSTRTTGCQFSFTCDGSLARKPSASGWLRSQKIAQAALSGRVYAPVGHATHYHADYVVPYWAPTLDKLVQVGRHIFYRWMGRAGKAGAFGQRYAQAEMVPAPTVPQDPALPPPDPAVEQALASAPLDVLRADQGAALSEIAAFESRPAPSIPAKPLAEDRRDAPRLLADVRAGTLRQPSDRATRTSTAVKVGDETSECVQSRRAAPMQPDRATTPRLSGSLMGCS